MSLLGYTIKELEKKLHNKEMSATELIDLTFKRIKEVDKDIGAFVTLDEENAYRKAKELDETGSTNEKLFALPSGIKDNIVTKGLRTTCSSKFLDNFNDPLYNATVIDKLNSEKAITIGKLNLDEFAMGSTTETSSYQITRNPWNTDHVPGGSSGGSAAAVAAGEVLFSLGSDTGGSVRQPASFCGVVGMKPTYGLVSRYGLVAMASSLDQIGPITQTVEDNARLLEVIAGYDNRDATSEKIDIPAYSEGLAENMKGLKVAVPEEYLGDGVEEDVKESIQNAINVFEQSGATIEYISLPHTKYAAAAYRVIADAEASTGLARFDGVRFGVRADTTNMIDMMKESRANGFGDEVKRRILLGTYALSANNYETYFIKAQKIRTLIKEEFKKVFGQYDVVIGPTAPSAAYEMGAKNTKQSTKTMADNLVVPVNLAGLPAISVPCGFNEAGLPLGLQIIGNHFDERTIYQVANAYEKATDHHKKRPMLEGGTK